MSIINAITKEGEQEVEQRKDAQPIELPREWNEEEVRQRVESVSPELTYYIEGDWTETIADETFVYHPAKLVLMNESKREQVLFEVIKSYEKTQAEYRQEQTPLKQLEKRVVALEAQLETRK